jgi:hypothetical protein
MIKWCAKHPYQFSIYYFIFYLSFFEICEKLITVPVWIVHSSIDDMIPFSQYGIIPYFLWFPVDCRHCCRSAALGLKKRIYSFLLYHVYRHDIDPDLLLHCT